MKRQQKTIIFAVILTCLILTGFIEIKFLSPKRVLNQNWEPCGGTDYLKTGLDIFSTEKAQFNGDTLILEGDRKYLVKYCNFGTLWLTDLKKNYTAKYVHTISSKDW
jgi:hypothetical protein